MQGAQHLSWLPVAIPVAGATLGLVAWSNPRAFKLWLLAVTGGTVLMLIGTAWGFAEPPHESLPLMCLVSLAAFLSLLGQPVHSDNREAWLATVLLMGLGLGILGSRDRIGHLLLLLLLGLVTFLIYRYRNESVYDPWWGIGVCGAGMAGALTMLAVPPLFSVASLLTCVVLLPLVPFHGGYVAALAGLPGSLPAFLALLLPSLGFHGLRTLLPSLTEAALQGLAMLALISAFYGSLKALTRPRVRTLLAYAGLTFFSILWWYLAAFRTATPQTTLYLSAVGLATSGLLSAWYALRARYGDMDLRAISGLVRSMPRFALVLSLLALAAMGLPPFGVYSGFMGMLLAPSLPLSGALTVVVIAWVTASWYFLDLLQRLLFGRHRPELPHEDLRGPEFAALLLLLALLLALGVAPARYFFESGGASNPSRVVMGSVAWNE